MERSVTNPIEAMQYNPRQLLVLGDYLDLLYWIDERMKAVMAASTQPKKFAQWLDLSIELKTQKPPTGRLLLARHP